MNKLLLFLILVIYAAQLVSQESERDKKAYVDSLLEESFQSYAKVNINSSLIHAIKAVSLSGEINYSKGKARGNFYIAQVLWSLSQFEKTIKYLQLAEQEPYVSSDLILISEISRVKGRTYGSLKLHDLSVREFQNGLRYINQIKTTFEREYLTSLAYDNLAHSYFLQNHADSALYYLNLNKQLLDHSEDKRLFRNQINLYAQLGKAHAIQEEYEEATNYFSQAFEIAEANNYPYTSWIYLQWGSMLRKQGQLDSAIVKFKDGLSNLKKTNLQSELIDAYSSLRDTYIQKGENDSALVYHQCMTAIESELAEANVKAVNMAIQILLQEEKSHQAARQKKIITTALVVLGIVSILSIGIWARWRKRYKEAVKKEQELQDALEEKLGDALEEIVELARQNDSSFLPHVMELFPRFTQQIYLRHPDLSQSAFQFCTYLFLHFSSKEIAEFMFIEHKSVQTRKNRLRKQLGLPRNTDLYHYMRSLDELEEETPLSVTDDPNFF